MHFEERALFLAFPVLPIAVVSVWGLSIAVLPNFVVRLCPMFSVKSISRLFLYLLSDASELRSDG